MPGLTASIDIGGTFTDIIIQRGSNITGYYKVPTTPSEPEVGALSGLSDNLGENKVSALVHATTIGTNALLGQYGLEVPDIALLTTKGFKDVIEIGRQNRPRLYDLYFQRPRMIVSRNDRYEVDERVDSEGKVLLRANEAQIEEIIRYMDGNRIKSVAVSFINSYLNPANEELAEKCLRKKFPYLSISSRIAPEQREYERTSTAVVNASLMPIVSRYVRSLEDKIKKFGSPEVSIMASSGGLVSTDEVYRRPVQIVESGPAAGVIAASEISKLLGIDNVISFDMGGTTAKAGTVVRGEVTITSEYEVGGESHHGRITKGSGYPVRFPFVDLAEVSAGGGTIIWKDVAGALKIGPVSSGAEPGPICYGRGGTEPTITDANLALGIIGQELLGGEMSLNLQSAIEGLSKLGEPFEVADAALNLADLEMARAIRIVTVEKGIDPSEFTMIAFGGAGPQRAAKIAEELGVKDVIVPPRPGLFSALGLLFSDWRFEARASFPDDPEMEYVRLERELSSKHRGARFLRYADCRYRGQGSELTVSVKKGTSEEIEDLFTELHRVTFGFNLDRYIEIVAIRVFAIIERSKPELSHLSISEMEEKTRIAIVNGSRITLRSYSKPGLKPGYVLEGPCAIDDYDSTTFVPEGWSAEVGDIGEIRLKREEFQ